MKIRKGIFSKLNVLFISLSFLLSIPAGAEMKMEHGQGAGHGMAMHHQHLMLNHALGMTLEGSNMVMLGQMEMAKGVDSVSADHGKMMMKNGRQLWNELMSGDTMMKMHAGGTTPADDPMMKHTHELAEAQLKVMDILSKMGSMPHTVKAHDMTMHHEHMMLNHALKMGVEGSNMIMLGQMGMAKGIDDISVEHGKMMMRHANSLFNEIMSGETMMKMHGEGMTPEKDPMMEYTHKLAEAQMKVMNLLKMMHSVM